MVGRGDQAHADEILQRVVAGLLDVGQHGELADEAEQQGVAVRRRLRHEGGADGASRPGTVLHDELLPEPLAELLGDVPSHVVVAASGRCRHDDPHGLRRVGLRCGIAGAQRKAEHG
jgi:hypothetical protein